MTITNLQEALVIVKQELDELRQNNQQEVSVGWAARWFGTSKSNQKSVHDVRSQGVSVFFFLLEVP